MKKGMLGLTFAIFVFGILFQSCDSSNESKLLEQTITKTNLPEIVSNLKQENIMSPEDIIIFSNGIGRLSNVKPDTLIGLTVQQVIDMQNNFNKELNFAQLTTTSTRVAMNINYSIKYLGVQAVRDTLKNVEGNTIIYEIKNNYDKAIKTVSGLMQFYNQQNQIIKQFQLENPEQIPPNGSLQFYKAFTHDNKELRDSIIRYHNSELIVRWQPQVLEFSDGVKFEIK